MSQKTTHVFANHGMPLECDVYDRQDSTADDKPVFLFFHAGGLVGSGRDRLPPWLVQVCLQRKWPLISASYRLMPQPGGSGLLQDASAAYEFAQKWKSPEGTRRRVIVAGASAGFFPTVLVAHHCSPPPLALFSLCGINTFRHSFFNSSNLLSPVPIEYSEIEEFTSGPPVLGITAPHQAFTMDKLLPDGSRNPDYKLPPTPVVEQTPGHYSKGDLYEYYTHKNKWIDLLGAVDLGYSWAQDPSAQSRREKWPQTVMFHGDNDAPVPHDISVEMRDSLGKDKVRLFIAPGEGHLFEQQCWIEDEGPSMTVVKEAVHALDECVSEALKDHQSS